MYTRRNNYIKIVKPTEKAPDSTIKTKTIEKNRKEASLSKKNLVQKSSIFSKGKNDQKILTKTHEEKTLDTHADDFQFDQKQDPFKSKVKLQRSPLKSNVFSSDNDLDNKNKQSENSTNSATKNTSLTDNNRLLNDKNSNFSNQKEKLDKLKSPSTQTCPKVQHHYFIQINRQKLQIPTNQ